MSKGIMPAENVFNFDNVEDMIERSVQKIRKVLENHYLLPQEVKELQEVLDYQNRIQTRVRLLLDNSESEGIDQDDLTSTRWDRLGGGCFGTVYKAKMKGASVAVKILKATANSQQLKNEGRILRLLRHDNVVAYRGMAELKKDVIEYKLEKGSLMIVMEYIPDNLATYVESLKTHEVHGLPKNQIWDFGQQIISGLYYLHSCFIAHRDLKPDNVLVEKGVARMRLKLADFGGAFRNQSSEEDFIDEQNQRWTAPEIWFPMDYGDGSYYDVDFYMRCDIYSYGLVLFFMMTGEKPWSEEASWTAVYARGKQPEVFFPDKLKGPLKEICERCCDSNPCERPTAEELVTKHFQAHEDNPYTVAIKTAEFFTCGFLRETQIVVADSLVDESLGFTYGGDKRPVGYPPDCLLCKVEIGKDEHNDCPENFVYREKYLGRHEHWRLAALDNEIDDNPNIALKKLTTPREGEDEEQRVRLEFAQATYVHHRAMRDVWKDLEEDEKGQILPCKTSVHPVFSTSFGLHMAVLTADQPRMFVFTRRAKRGGMASPGTFTCGAVESCSTKDYIKRGDTTYVDLAKTAARGLEEELGVVLTGRDVEAICLTTVYLKYDNHEWGMCGFVDLSDERIAPEHRLKFSSLRSRFTGGPKDKFEHDRLVAIPFKLHEMAHFVRENFHEFASSAKVVVVKVLQSFFGVSEVEDTFKALDASD